MKSHYDYMLTESQAKRIGNKYAKEEIDRFNREELPKIKASLAKLFCLACYHGLGIGPTRLERVLDALTELTCDMHNLIIDGVFNDIFDKRLKEAGLWDVYDNWCNQTCQPMSEGSKYLEVSKSEVDDDA